MSPSDPLFQTPAWVGVGSPHVATSPLKGNEVTDLVIVGAGILGLTTALSGARAGLAVRVLEASTLGRGASSWNGGQVIPGLKHDPDWLTEHLGSERGGRLVRFAGSAADRVFDLIAAERLAVPHARNAWIQAAVTETALAAGHARARQWILRGAPAELLDATAVARLTGARGYVGGWLDKRAGTIDPLAYVQELGRVAAAAGVAMAERTRALGLAKTQGGWTVATDAGFEVRARRVLVATNAVTDGLVRGLAETLVPLHSFQIATAPLGEKQLATILPGEQAVSESRRILVYYRRGPNGRVVLGGRGRMGLPKNAADWRHLEHALVRLFPALAGVPVDYRWYGRVAMTMDHMPHLHEPEPGLVAFVGCQGRGVALMTAMGLELGPALASGDLGGLPFPVSPLRPIPFHALRQVGVAAAIAASRVMDALER